MAIILNIDTAVESASVCLAREARPVRFEINNKKKDHISWLHPAIERIIADEGLTINELQAVAVTIGPGSYTGLRVGLSAAKGLCFALDIPLIVINTLEMMAHATRNEDADLFCPMIDARRMEVFTAVYDKNLIRIIDPSAMIPESTSFDSLLLSRKILFSGNGSEKIKEIIRHPNAAFSDTIATAADMAYLSEKDFEKNKIADLAYTEPVYLKEFYLAAR